MTLSPSAVPLQIDDQSYSLLEPLFDLAPGRVFDETRIAFVSALSRKLMTGTQYKSHPDLVALGFWLRESHLKTLQIPEKILLNKSKQLFRKPLGLVMHICPGNVDSMFVYSWICSLLMGNNNIVRIPTQSTQLQHLLMQCLSELFDDEAFEDIAQRNLIVHWHHGIGITEKLSRRVQGRVVWGGDKTVESVRNLSTAPNCRDITFADKFSVSAINLDGISVDELKGLSDRLWKDMSAFGQAACSSPKVLAFLGYSDEGKDKKRQFYQNLAELAASSPLSDASRMNHFVTEQLLRTRDSDNNVCHWPGFSVQKIDRIKPEYLSWHPGENYLYEAQFQNLASLFAELPRHCQTISHCGLSCDELESAISNYTGEAADRLVPMGKALEFSSNWDGYQLLHQLSRVIELQT